MRKKKRPRSLIYRTWEKKSTDSDGGCALPCLSAAVSAAMGMDGRGGDVSGCGEGWLGVSGCRRQRMMRRRRCVLWNKAQMQRWETELRCTLDFVGVFSFKAQGQRYFSFGSATKIWWTESGCWSAIADRVSQIFRLSNGLIADRVSSQFWPDPVRANQTAP